MPEKLKRYRILIGLFLIGMAALVPNVQAEFFTIEEFAADITVRTDGVLEISETLAIEFSRQRHGIYRDIPFKYTSDNGNQIEMPVDVRSVTDQNGQKRDFSAKAWGNTVRVQIGSADSYVSGRQVYVIKYQVENALLFMEDHDELYWNVTGNNWEAPIEKVVAQVRVDTEQPLGNIDAACYTGRYGSTEVACGWIEIDDGAQFRAERRLSAGEGLTIAMGWDKGIVSPPSAFQKLWWQARPADNWVWLVPIISLIGMTVSWFRKGRDPKVREAITVQYGPPEVDGKPLSAAEVGTLIDEKLDERDISGGLIGLGVKGYLKIEETTDPDNEGSPDYRLVKLRDADTKITPFEGYLHGIIFEAGRDSVRASGMTASFGLNLIRLHRLLYRQLKDKGLYATDPQHVRAKYSGYGMVVLIFTLLAGIFTATGGATNAIAAAIISGAIIMAFSKIMPARTRRGALARNHILGFQEFMTRADKDRIERLGKDVFYKYMPYAIALGVTDRWADAFKGIETTPPDWYIPRTSFVHFSPRLFARTLTTTTSTISMMTYAAPRGSGLSGGGTSGGGGGFSGGGGGGGGGGSW